MMKLFKDSRGFIFTFGFAMPAGVPNSRIICWCDPKTHVWEQKADNLAGFFLLDYDISPEFVREVSDGIIAYQPGFCLELALVGKPYIWSLTRLQPA